MPFIAITNDLIVSGQYVSGNCLISISPPTLKLSGNRYENNACFLRCRGVDMNWLIFIFPFRKLWRFYIRMSFSFYPKKVLIATTWFEPHESKKIQTSLNIYLPFVPKPILSQKPFMQIYTQMWRTYPVDFS